MTSHRPEAAFNLLKNASAAKRVTHQHEAANLLLENHRDAAHSVDVPHDTCFRELTETLSDASTVFGLTPVQREVYHADSGTAFVPRIVKKALVDISERFVVRPGCLDDLQIFVAYAHAKRLKYTIRGSGTWPFGGAVPLNKDVVLDLSYLDFDFIDTDAATLTVGPGAIFAKLRQSLKEKGFAFRQEITNPHSGTICGWAATGGVGLGAYKYGPIRNSIVAMLLLQPDGTWQTVTPDDELFARVLGSEGQLGIIAGLQLKLRELTYVSKPYAFSFPTVETARKFMQKISEWGLQPTTVLYFDHDYMQTTHAVESKVLQQRLQKALDSEDSERVTQVRAEMELVKSLTDLQHVVVLEFDSHADYQKALKLKPFTSDQEKRRFQDMEYWRLSVDLAHKLWEHRYLPVEMKPAGPSMLVSETILPLAQLDAYMDFVQAAISNWTGNRVKTEAHLISSDEMLIQTILLADTAKFRHKVYVGLVPFMTQSALYFGGRAYGIGIWNLPFMREKEAGAPPPGVQTVPLSNLLQTKRRLDKEHLINHGKYLNWTGRSIPLRAFKRLSPLPMKIGVILLHRGKSSTRPLSPYGLGKLLWKGSRLVIPRVMRPDLRSKRHPILELTAPCAECDSCEKVCPTSDVFGMYGLATPITRRKTANRLATGQTISQKEALGFLVCTRCDNCTRVCPTNIPLTELFDLVEQDNRFQMALNMEPAEKAEFIDRFWQIMKESPLYLPHTKAEQKEEKSHLEHGLKIKYTRGFAYGKLFIDDETCIRCGMCAHENACMYDAREGLPRLIPNLLDENCALCNACINFCPQNKETQKERQFITRFIENAVDRDERKYWEKHLTKLRDTTTIQRAPEITEMADKYFTESVLMEIDKEASTGQIPVSGMGQGDRHMGIGFDAERFSHFHIVGPAQNRLHEGDPDEELSVILGKRHRYCRFNADENMNNPPFPRIKLKTPILYNTIPLDSHGRVERAMIAVADRQNTLVFMELRRLIEYYDFLTDGHTNSLPHVIVPRLDEEVVESIMVNPHTQRDLLLDLWQMPLFEIRYHPHMHRTIQYVKDAVFSHTGQSPMLCGYVEVAEHEMIGEMEVLPHILEKIDRFLENKVDVIHVHGLRNKDHYFVTSHAVRSIHHYLVDKGQRHLVSIIASGGIRLASDSQKTIQRGAEATLMDTAALLALDSYAYKAILERQTTTEKLLNLDIDRAVNRLNNQMESRKIQILEVLGASGFKDIKKTVGEEGRLVDFYALEERLQKDIFEQPKHIDSTVKLNTRLLHTEPITTDDSPRFSALKARVVTLPTPHHFYHLGEENQSVYQRDFVWPGPVIESFGKMAKGDPGLFLLKNVKGTGQLGDGFDMMKILYQRDPDMIPEAELDDICTAVYLDKDLILRAPWMFGGKSVGSIGLDTWRAHVIAARELGIQYDTGEGGYPTCFFLNAKGEPLFFTEPEIQAIKGFFEHNRHYNILHIKQILSQNGLTADTQPHIFEILGEYPELQPILFYEVVNSTDEAYVSTEMKTGLFGVTKETIKKTRRVVIAYSQGAKMGIGGHILAQKVNKLVSYLRGIEGIESLNLERVQQLAQRIEKMEKNDTHPLHQQARAAYHHLLRAQDDQEIFPELKQQLWLIQDQAFKLHEAEEIDPIEFEHIIRLCETVINVSYTSIISPFPFHNCYSIEDVKSFIDMVRMINPQAVISVKVSPSVDIEFIAAGLARIARDNTEEALKHAADKEAANRYGMTIEMWLDGPRGGTGASPNIIKGQMGMHIEYAVPLIHQRLVQDGLRNHLKFFVSGGIRTYEDVIKTVALGADGVIWGTAPLVAIGCDRNRNCHDGCSRGIATSNLIMQNLRNVEINSRQMINTFLIMQMQVIRALAGLGLKDIRELRGRFDKLQWIGLKERVDFRMRQRGEYELMRQQIMQNQKTRDKNLHPTGQTNCGVAAIIGTEPIPSDILDQTLHAMKNRGMDGVGVGKTLCFPAFPDHYAFRIMVKGRLQTDFEAAFGDTIRPEQRRQARQQLIAYRIELATIIKRVFLTPYFDFSGNTEPSAVRESYKRDADGQERDYRDFGSAQTDPGDIFRFFVRVKTDVLHRFIEEILLVDDRYVYIREYFPEVTFGNYQDDSRFLQKAEDLFVFRHATELSQILYVRQPNPDSWHEFVNQTTDSETATMLCQGVDLLDSAHLQTWGKRYLERLLAFSQTYRFGQHRRRYTNRQRRIATIMSAGKNFAIWKTAGREIPWETPAAPNNIIHVRLATGSVVEQMNAHPFGKLHTALTHNGETTNYEALKQRVEQFGLLSLATTDTEVASLKFHLLADELEYPDWALYESFSPTTGDDLALLGADLRPKLEEVQRVEFASSPDGPYQYLCLRHRPEQRVTERIDLRDPADLRPGTTGFWIDRRNGRPRVFSMIASEEQAIQKMTELLGREGLMDGMSPDFLQVNNGMISRFHYDEQGQITDVEFIDRYGRTIEIAPPGDHFSMRDARTDFVVSDDIMSDLEARLNDAPAVVSWTRQSLSSWDFETYGGVLHHLVTKKNNRASISTLINILTRLIDTLRTMPTETMAKSSLTDMTRFFLYDVFDQITETAPDRYHRVRKTDDFSLKATRNDLDMEDATLVIDATGFEPEGTDPSQSLAALLSAAYDEGWRHFILYRVRGQRLISTAVMGHDSTDTDDVVMDVYGTPGEYFAAFMQGGTIRLHGNAQNFTAMGMHHGTLQVFGHAGKVCGYAAKGGHVTILGDIVDRAWTNSVNDSRCQSLEVNILGSASKYAGESLMGGDFFFGGLYFDTTGTLRIQPRPYRGTKLLGGASRGHMLFFDPNDQLDPHQYGHGRLLEIEPETWPRWQQKIASTLQLAGVPVTIEGERVQFELEGKQQTFTPSHFKLITAKGSLKGYESH